MEEIWNPIVCQDIKIGWYEVSNLGRVRHAKYKRLLSPFKSKGYMRIGLITNNRGQQKFPVHRLVATAFVNGYSEEKHFVNHIDGNKFNNTAENLEWVTASENTIHAIQTGLLKVVTGENNGHATITEKEARRICQLLLETNGEDLLVSQLAKDEGIIASPGLVGHIKRKSTWKIVSDDYFDENHFKISSYIELKQTDVVCICQSLLDNEFDIDSTMNDCTNIPNLTIGKVNHIRAKNCWVKISDRYFFEEDVDTNHPLHKAVALVTDIRTNHIYISNLTRCSVYIADILNITPRLIHDKLVNFEDRIGDIFHVKYVL